VGDGGGATLGVGVGDGEGVALGVGVALDVGAGDGDGVALGDDVGVGDAFALEPGLGVGRGDEDEGDEPGFAVGGGFDAAPCARGGALVPLGLRATSAPDVEPALGDAAADGLVVGAAPPISATVAPAPPNETTATAIARPPKVDQASG
jgi:hypothetical protein